MSHTSLNTGEISLVLGRVQSGEHGAWDILYKLAFRRLRLTAASLLRRERPGHTLQATALIAESFLKLHRIRQPILGAEHFFNLSARAMRQVLIDHSRHRGDHVKVQPAALAELLPRAVWSQPVTDESIAVRALLSRLRILDSLAAESICLRYIEGLTIDEVGRRLGRDTWSDPHGLYIRSQMDG